MLTDADGKPRKGCRNTWNADEGACELLLPDELSEENLKEVEYWIEGCLRRYRRAVERSRMSEETMNDLKLHS